MDYTSEDLIDLIQSPRESLAIEFKQWIDPSTPEGIAKIAKGCLALRNNNGGCLIIGFTNSGMPDTSNVPGDVRTTFHPDAIQQIVSKYASQPFEVKVELVERGGTEYPVICVPGGVETPVAAKSDLLDNSGKLLVKTDTVYVRSLNANNIVSSTAARWKDWERVTRICFDNREADVGAFIRRHLSGLDLGNLAAPSQPKPTPIESAVSCLDSGKARFEAICEQRHVEPRFGFREAAIVADGQVQDLLPNEEFLTRLLLSMPQHTGWPPWLDSRGFPEKDRPFVIHGGWEAFLAELEQPSIGMYYLDFWRLDPRGQFYCLRALEDDLRRSQSDKPQPSSQFDFSLQIARVAEIISVGLSFARSMGCDEKTTSLACAFRWSGLCDRHLASWADPNRLFFPRGDRKSRQDQITTTTVVPLETPSSSLAAYVEQVVAPLFVLFGGMKFDSRVIQDIVNKILGVER